jgi:hypothetical protein
MKRLPVRLALRQEGSWWVAYLAHADKMEGAHEIGRILLGVVRGNPSYKAAFQQLMTEIMADAIEDIVGRRPEMQIGAAPDNEKSGNA